MTRYRTVHRTQYRYAEPMSHGATVARLRPTSSDRQTVIDSTIVIEPEPNDVAEWTDRFGNQTTQFTIERPHDQLIVTSTSVVDVHWTPDPPASGTWNEAVTATHTDTSADGLIARACTADSRYVTVDDAVRDYASLSFVPGRLMSEALFDITLRIQAEFEFDPGFSDVSTPLDEVLTHRRGVCQDFAHLLIGCLRSVGLGARYISGYIENEPPPGQQRLVGADASHAWCAAYVPGHGWVEMDPTNGLVYTNRHIRVATGRDYGDIAPLHGVVFGPAGIQRLDVAVDVMLIASPPLARQITPL